MVTFLRVSVVCRDLWNCVVKSIKFSHKFRINFTGLNSTLFKLSLGSESHKRLNNMLQQQDTRVFMCIFSKHNLPLFQYSIIMSIGVLSIGLFKLSFYTGYIYSPCHCPSLALGLCTVSRLHSLSQCPIPSVGAAF